MGAFEWFLVAVGLLIYPIYSNWILSKQLDYRFSKQDDKIDGIRRMALHAHKRQDDRFNENIVGIHYDDRKVH